MNWTYRLDLEKLKDDGLYRQLRSLHFIDARKYENKGIEGIHFSSNDYLGLAQEAWLVEVLAERVKKYGAGAGASRLISGNHQEHVRLEEVVAQIKGTEAALTFQSGFVTAQAVITALVGVGDTVILDKLCHASLIDAVKLSGATLRVFPHQNLDRLEVILQKSKGRVLVIVESVYSMDGDLAPLKDIVELKEKYGAWLMIDEAHAFGCMGENGEGLSGEEGIKGRVELLMGTLSKAVGLSGGYIACSAEIRNWLINRSRSFIYTTAPLPAIASAAIEVIKWIQGGEAQKRREKLVLLNRALCHGLKIKSSVNTSPIVPLIVGGSEEALDMQEQLLENHFFIPAIRYPTVARGQARLRISLSALHELADITGLVDQIKRIKLV